MCTQSRLDLMAPTPLGPRCFICMKGTPPRCQCDCAGCTAMKIDQAWSRRPATLAARLGFCAPSATGLLGLAMLADCSDWQSWQHHGLVGSGPLTFGSQSTTHSSAGGWQGRPDTGGRPDHAEPTSLTFPPLGSDILPTHFSNVFGTTIEQPWWSGNHRSNGCLDCVAPPLLGEECTHHGVPETAGFTGNKSHILTGNGKWSGGKGWSSKGKGTGYQQNDQQAPFQQAPFQQQQYGQYAPPPPPSMSFYGGSPSTLFGSLPSPTRCRWLHRR